MSKVALTFRIEPKEGADLEKIKQKVKELGAKDVREIPIAFGIKHLEALFITEKNPDSIENALKTIDGVANVESEKVTLL